MNFLKQLLLNQQGKVKSTSQKESIALKILSFPYLEQPSKIEETARSAIPEE